MLRATAAVVATVVTSLLVLEGPRLLLRLSAQQATAAPPPSRQFEVASVKPNTSGRRASSINVQPGGRFDATNVPLERLIVSAYRILPEQQLLGASGWVKTDPFDVVAKSDGPATAEEMSEMLRSLLEERFSLEVHRETRELPIYALVVSRPDGTLGDQLKRSGIDCAALSARARSAVTVPSPPSAPGEPPCGTQMRPGRFTGRGTALSQLAMSLGATAGRIVQDKTGLTGTFDIELSWTPERGGQLGPGGIDGGVSLFTAIQEQLGLKLESQRGPVEVIVIDSVSRPTSD